MGWKTDGTNAWLSRARAHLPLALLLAFSASGLYLGWRLFWFLTDDAFISFRYVSNSIHGYGYVWNPPPFLPVEGYSNFLWIVLLDIVWRLSGIEPPASSNYLSLFFAFFSLLIAILMILALRLNAHLDRYRMWLLGLVLFGTLTNRTFLAWTSSGLETAMFNGFLHLWLFVSLFTSSRRPWWPFLLSLSSSLLALTRPDGLLFWLAGTALLAWHLIRDTDRLTIRRALCFAPAFLVPAHLLWRRATYGEWLPNSYYAKVSTSWPESGLRYLLSFALEYALWTWLALLLFVLLKQAGRSSTPRCPEPQALLKKAAQSVRSIASDTGLLARLVSLSAIAFHLTYYTLVIGGDHFEYRVYSHTIPLLFVFLVWLLNRSGLQMSTCAAIFSLLIICSYPVPWTHWWQTRALATRKETFRLKAPVAPYFPRPIAWYGELFDRLQFWLIDRSVCMRHQEHKVFWQVQVTRFPSRERGLRYPSGGYPVFAFAQVGIPSWVLPNINIIDILGLNDYVIARYPIDLDRNTDSINPRGVRQMAHDRRPPPGYLEGFEPNVRFSKGFPPAIGDELEIAKRPVEMTARKVHKHEAKWRLLARSWTWDR